MIVNLLKPRKELLAIFSAVRNTGDIPESSKVAWVVPILKLQKDAAALCSYRPVSLTSCVVKVMEKLVQIRLNWFVEHTRKLPSCMTEFRQRLCAQDSVLDLVSHIEHHRGDRL